MFPLWLLFLACCGNVPDGSRHANTTVRTQSGNVVTLTNGRIVIRIDLAKGGSIVWLSSRSRPQNMVNDHDLGREIQQSYYSGPHPYGNPKGAWVGAGWNPIASGDAFGNSPLAVAKMVGNALHVSARPLQWALQKVPCECRIESWYSLNGETVSVRQRLTVDRNDHTQYPGDAQEVPAAYFNGFLNHPTIYTGDAPFTGAPVTRLPAAWPAQRMTATENWAAMLDGRDEGVGIISPDSASFDIGFAGKPGSGGEHDDQTGYISPRQMAIIDHDIVFDTHFLIVVGTLRDIRAAARAATGSDRRPSYVFRSDRQGWIYANARDAGWPIGGRLHIAATASDPQMIGPRQPFSSHDVRSVFITAAFSGPGTYGQLFWTSAAKDGFSEDASVRFDTRSDGVMRTYTVPVATSAQWHGTITALRFDPPGGPGSTAEICAIAAVPTPCPSGTIHPASR